MPPTVRYEGPPLAAYGTSLIYIVDLDSDPTEIQGSSAENVSALACMKQGWRFYSRYFNISFKHETSAQKDITKHGFMFPMEDGGGILKEESQLF